MRSRVGWLLSLEPVGELHAWSLMRADGSGTRLVDAGVDAVGHDVPTEFELASNARHGLVGVLTDSSTERRTCARWAGVLLPAELITSLKEERAQHTLNIAARGWASQVPWAALNVVPGGDLRLVELCRVVGAMSPAITVTRQRSAPGWDDNGIGLLSIDPGPLTGDLGPLYPSGLPDLMTNMSGFRFDDMLATWPTSPETLGQQLTHLPWSSWFYMGHLVGELQKNQQGPRWFWHPTEGPAG